MILKSPLVLIVALGALAAQVRAEQNPPAAPAPADIEAQYAAVLSAMKYPPVSGVLVTEIGPASPAGAAGLRGGDIIVKLEDSDVRTLQALRAKVADLVALHVELQREGNVVLQVRRAVAAGAGKNPSTQAATESVKLQVPREPLGIRAIEVEAGVPAALNPPLSVRGSVAMAWDELRKLQNAGGDLGQDCFLRNTEADDLWLGWQKRGAAPVADDELSGNVDVYHVAVEHDEAKVVRSEKVSFRIRTGDYAVSPPFLLEEAQVATRPGDGSVETIAARRAGAMLRTQSETVTPEQVVGPIQRQRECPMPAMIPSALPLIAAAMPQQKEAVIPVCLMSVRDFVARPGYVLATRGKQALPASKAGTLGDAWRVDLVHCGIVIESYWLSDQRKLLRIDSFGGTALVSRRVPTELEARGSAEEKPAPPVPSHVLDLKP